MKSTKSIEETYTKKTQLEHILLRPDTYIGSVERYTQPMWVLGDDGKLVHRNINYVPGLYKIFDEILVNAADNKQRDKSMNRLQVEIQAESNTISVWNNGKGIPIVMHAEHKVYIPELIFGHLLTGSNFDDTEDKTTGGRNGYGAKLANIFSTEFIVETVDSSRGLQYKQVFRNNMSVLEPPVISKFSGSSDYTCITFKPDLRRFKMDHLEEDTVALFGKRVYDIGGANKLGQLAVFLNGSRINIRNFKEYVQFYTSSSSNDSGGGDELIAFETVNDRWEVGVGISDGTFHQVSFVNSICTNKGGTHVQYIADQITSHMAGQVKKKNKGAEVKPANIRNHLFVYVNALITNPAFDSQSKETLTSRPNTFNGQGSNKDGGPAVLSEKTLKAIEKSSLIEHILRWAKTKQDQELKKKGGSKLSKLVGIPKLDDANYAGTSKSKDCTLILTEGDSAKALAISGLGVIGRDYYGVFPLKGKLLNVREAAHQQIMKNEEIQNIAKIMGLTFGRKYEDVSSLRYGHLLIMTDQDHDGSHIKGLLINFIHHFWPSLLKIEGFLQQFITPIVKCSRGKSDEETFYTIPQYQSWRETHNDGKGWRIKYYKGLGTSTAAEAKEYFSNLPKHLLSFSWSGGGDEESNNAIDLAFSKKRADDRKTWLLGMEMNTFIDYTVEAISYPLFVNKELVLFSHADNARSIPHVMDGFKPSQRKVLFSCFKRNLKNEIKVAQLAGYVSEHSAYHHGEMSLTQTIVGMAQNYVGSNNINLLSPCGQFGTRLMGGKDAASPRYVFTKLESITRAIFHPDDDALLPYLDEDGQSIEPEFYAPIIPMLLVNGCEGIGTGWSTSVPQYNPRDIIANLRRMIVGEPVEDMHPWYRGFEGEITAKTGRDSRNYSVTGKVGIVDDETIAITELPVGRWTTDYKQMLETMIIGNTAAAAAAANGDVTSAGVPIIKDFKENHTDSTVSFTVRLPVDKLEALLAEPGGVFKRFKLEGSVATTNMHAFDLAGHIKKFECAKEIMRQFFDVRIDFYERRKAHLLDKLAMEFERLDNKVRFILAVIQGTIVVSNRKKNDIFADLQRMGFKTVLPEKSVKAAQEEDGEGEGADDSSAATSSSAGSLDKGYDYLLSMKLWNLTMEKVQQLTSERDSKKQELQLLRSKTCEDLWLNDLDQLEAALTTFENHIAVQQAEEEAARMKAQKGGKGSGRGAAVAAKTATIQPIAKPVIKAAIVKPAATHAKSTSSRAPTATTVSEPRVKEDEEDAPLSLAARLMQRMNLGNDDESNSASSSRAFEALLPSKGKSKTTTKAGPKATTTAKAKKAAPTRKKSYDTSDDEEDFDEIEDSGEDSDVESYAPAASSRAVSRRPARAAAVKAISYKFDDEEEEYEDAAMDESDSDDSSADNEDFSKEEEAVPKPVLQNRKPAARKAAVVIKDDSEDDFSFEPSREVSRGPLAPVATNVFPATCGVTSATITKPAVAKAPKGTAAPKPRKTTASKKKTAATSDDELDAEADFGVKPSNATVAEGARSRRAVVQKKSYVISDDDEDTFESEEDFGDDDEDDFNSDDDFGGRKKASSKKKAAAPKAAASKKGKKAVTAFA